MYSAMAMIVAPFSIAGRMIGPGNPCLIVAEISANHGQKYEEAEVLIRAAKDAGADAVKLQTYTPDTMTIDSDKKWFYLGGTNTPELWKKSNLYSLYGTAYTPWEWQGKLKELAEGLGLIFFSTPFDASAVDFLEKINVPCYKIASYEATDIPLLKKVAATGRPVILSVGFAVLPEVEEAIETLRAAGTRGLAVLHCVTAYANEPNIEQMNVATIQDIAEHFGVVAGFSDNNAGIEAPIAAVYAGASVVEKHFILSREKGGPDARFSLEPQEFAEMVKGIRRAEMMLGTPQYGPVSKEEENYRNLRRSLFVVKDMAEDEVFTGDNVRVIRPGYGLPAREYDRVIGKRAARALERGTPLTSEDVRK